MNQEQVKVIAKACNLSSVSDATIEVELLIALDVQLEDGRRFSFSEQDFKDIMANFEDNVLGREVFVDVGHMAEDPQRAKSYLDLSRFGKVTGLRLGESQLPETVGIPVLIAEIELNKLGKEAVDNGRFAYTSASVKRQMINKATGEAVDTWVLSSIALLNTPAEPFLAPIGSPVKAKESLTLSSSSWFLAKDSKLFKNTRLLSGLKTNKKENNMGKKTPKAVHMELSSISLESLRENLRGALIEKLEVTDVYVRDVVMSDGGNYVIFEVYDEAGDSSSEVQGYTFTVDKENAFEALGEPVEIEKSTGWKIKTEEKTPKADETPAEEQTLSVVRHHFEKKPRSTGKDLEAELRVLRAERREMLLSNVIRTLKEPNADGYTLPPFAINSISSIAKAITTKDGGVQAQLLSAVKSLNLAEAEGDAAVKDVQEEVAKAVNSLNKAVKEEAPDQDTLTAMLDALMVALVAIINKVKEMGMSPPEDTEVTASAVPHPDKRNMSVGDKIQEKATELLSANDPRLNGIEGDAARLGYAQRLAAEEINAQEA